MEKLVEPPSLLQTLRAHRGEVACADAFGARLATGGGDRTLRLWRWSGGGGWAEEAAQRNAHKYGVTAARWSPGGALLASGGVDGALRVWCGRTLGTRRTLAAPDAAAVRALCWAGARVLAGHDDGALCVWHAPRAELLARMGAHQGALHAIAAPAGGALLLTVCTEGVLKVFDLVEVCLTGTEGVCPAPLTWVDSAHDLGAQCAAANDSGRAAATGGHDARVRVWRASLDARLGRWNLQDAGTLEGHAATVTALRWAGGGDAAALLASAALDRTARLWDAAARACLHVVQAHPRYLTCVALDYHLRYMITGSNDKSIRMWSLGALALDDELEPSCSALSHFALGDLEGIGPVDDDEVGPADAACDEAEADDNGSRRVWLQREAHGPINCISVYGDVFATASSSGKVHVYRWSAASGRAEPLHALHAHAYPALACELGAGGALLLTAGLDASACLWDVQMGCVLRSLSVPTGNTAGGDAGGGGVRGARLSPHRPPYILLATDDALAPVWNLADPDPNPIYMYGGHAEAVTCCAWSSDGRVLATAAASGELALHAPPPAPRSLHTEPQAHDLGVQSCDFAQNGNVPGLPEGEGTYLLATAGADSLVKLWIIETDEEYESTRVRLTRSVRAHGGGASCVRWGAGALLASSGGDGWARVWRVGAGGRELRAAAAVPTGGVGTAPAVALIDAEGENSTMIAVGTLRGDLALWRLPDTEHALEEDGDPPRFWAEASVVRWLREYVTRAPDMNNSISAELAVEVEERARAARLTGARLLDEPISDLMLAVFGYDAENDMIEIDLEKREKGEERELADSREALRTRLADELRWLRRDPPPPRLAALAPHRLLCPLSHRVLEEPARAADGFSYSRRALRERLLADEGAAASPVSGRGLRNRRLHPNHKLRQELHAFLKEHDQ